LLLRFEELHWYTRIVIYRVLLHLITYLYIYGSLLSVTFVPIYMTLCEHRYRIIFNKNNKYINKPWFD